MALEGWLFDLYPSQFGGMVIWLLTRSGDPIRLFDPWRPSLYVWARNLSSASTLFKANSSFVEKTIDYKYVNPGDFERSRVLRVTFQSSVDIASFLRNLTPADLMGPQFFNAGVPAAQLYLYEKDLFPLAFVRAELRKPSIRWELLDSAFSCQYENPPLRTASITLHIKKGGAIATFSDPLQSITFKFSDEVSIDAGSEAEKLLRLIELVKQADPDIILTRNGDAFAFPYLMRRAFQNGVLPQLILDREGRHLQSSGRPGRTYVSYGRVFYRPAPVRLLGRLHLDAYNDFMFENCGLQGLFEIARTCRTPLHRASRETIGTTMTSLQMYQAFRRDILIPWKKNEPENFKSAWELLQADRGGFILEPKVGLFDDVGEIDFASLYPALMMKYNLTPECIACACCGSTCMCVPELKYNLCEKKIGIVPHTLFILLYKRAKYKALMSHTTERALRDIYDQRQAALKWSLVCSFGYLGYRNARFGKIDAHIGVCAFARKVLRETVQIAQEHGFSVVHGIVDSVWLKKKGADEADYIDLCKTLEKRLELPASFEGIYRWIVFLPSKVHAELPVLNRYYGAFRDGKIKVRGIEYRRRDAPSIIKDCQLEVINYLAHARDAAEFHALLPGALKLVRTYVRRLYDGQVDAHNLLITKQLSKNPKEYRHNVMQAIAAKQLIQEGLDVSAGQNVSYILQSESGASVIPGELINGPLKYDAQRYVQLLLDAIASLLSPMGYSNARLSKEIQQDPFS